MSVKATVVLVLVVLSCAAAAFNVGMSVGDARGQASGFDRGKVAGYTVGRTDEAAVARPCVDEDEIRGRLWAEVESEVSGREAAEWREVVDAARAEGLEQGFANGYAQGREDWRRAPFLREYAR